MSLFANVQATPISSAMILPLRGVQHCVYREGDATPFHGVSYHHALLVTAGEAVFQERGQAEFVCRRGTFFMIPASVVYRWRIVSTMTMLQCIHGPLSFIEHRGLANIFGAANKHIFRCELRDDDLAVFEKNVAEDLREDNPVRGLRLSADWLKLMAIATATLGERESPTHPALAKALDFLAANSEGKVSLALLAKKAGLGVSRMSELFRKEVGLSPLHYHARLKAERATSLLFAGQSAGEIASRLGFQSESAFRRFYKKQTGLPPGQAVNRKSGH